MFSRITFLLITLFWVAMNYLLWRSEFGERNHLGSNVPVEVVWRKILTAPDKSDLGIIHNNKPIGHGTWSANIGQDFGTRKLVSDEPLSEGMAEAPGGYRIDFTGVATLNDVPGRLHIDFVLKLNTNHIWQEFGLVIKLHTSTWEIHSLAAEESVRIKMEDENEKYEHVFKFADLQNAETIARQLDLSLPSGLLNAMELSPKVQNVAPLSSGLSMKWEARNDWINIGHTSVRAYRLQTRLFDRYQITVLVSQVGEILHVELPDDWLLINNDLTNL